MNFMNLTLFFNNIFIEYGISILLLNLISYLLILFLLFSIIFTINVKNFKTLNQFSVLGNGTFFLMILIFSILSLAGMPPLLGFLGKFLIVIFLLYKNFFFFFIIFVLVNLFMIYFYIQNTRFLVKKTYSNKNALNLYFNISEVSYIFFINFINFINLFGIFFIEDIYIYLSNISLYTYL